MLCTSCGKETGQGVAYCPHCGVAAAGDVRALAVVPGHPARELNRTVGSLVDQPTLPGQPLGRMEPADTRIADRYDIQEILGEGGMGIVYRAIDVKLGRDVAIKRLRAPVDAARRGIERFRGEALAIASLKHRYIVTIHDLAEDEKGPFIVMEYLPGGDLRRYVQKKGKLSPAELTVVMKSVGLALTYAHGRGIFHRDIKPANILLTEDGTPKLVDFGLAQIARDSEISETGFGMGTLLYMPPEQKRDAKHVDHRSDIYALAKTYYFLATAELPDPLDLESLPVSVRPAIRKALRTQPAERQSSVEQFLRELQGGTGAPAAPPQEPEPALGTCPRCNRANPEDVKFCRGCGADLFAKCPRCGRLDRIGVKFCGVCGVRIDSYRAASESVARAQDHVLKGEYDRALKEVQQGLQWDYFREELNRVQAESEVLQTRIKAVLLHAHKLIDADRHEQAQATLQEAMTSAPLNRELAKLVEEIPDLIRKRDSRRLLQKAESHRAAGQYTEAQALVAQVLALSPDNAEAKAMVSALRAERTSRDVDAICQKAATLLRGKSFQEAISVLTKALEGDVPDGQKNRLRVALAGAVAAWTAALHAEAMDLLQKGEYAPAKARLVQATRADPANAPLRQLLERFPSLVLRHQTDTLVARARADVAENRFENVLETCNQLVQLGASTEQVDEFLAAAHVMAADHASRAKQAQALRAMKRPAEAADQLRQLLGCYRWDQRAAQELAGLQQQLASLLERESQALRFESRGRYAAAMNLWQSIADEDVRNAAATAAMQRIPKRLRARRRRRMVVLGLIIVGLGAIGWRAERSRRLVREADRLEKAEDYRAAYATISRTDPWVTPGRSDRLHRLESQLHTPPAPPPPLPTQPAPPVEPPERLTSLLQQANSQREVTVRALTTSTTAPAGGRWSAAETAREQGNAHFEAQHWDDAGKAYAAAIEAYGDALKQAEQSYREAERHLAGLLAAAEKLSPMLPSRKDSDAAVSDAKAAAEEAERLRGTGSLAAAAGRCSSAGGTLRDRIVQATSSAITSLLDGYRETGDCAPLRAVLKAWSEIPDQSELPSGIEQARQLLGIVEIAEPATLTAPYRDSVPRPAPLLALATWRRLGELHSQWPGSLDDLRLDVGIAEYVLKGADNIRPELEQGIKARWTLLLRHCQDRPELTETICDALLKADESATLERRLRAAMPAEMGFNLLLYRAKKGLLNPVQFRTQAAKFVEDAPSLQGRTAKLLEGLKGPGVTDQRLGPASKGWVERIGTGGPESKAFGPPAGGGDDAPRQYVHFMKVQSGADGPPPFFLCCQEVSVQFVQSVLKQTDHETDFVGLLAPDAKLVGPRGWQLKPLGANTVRFGLAANWMGEREPAPENNPMQHVTPEAALYFATLVGCRLPTPEEWKAALAQELRQTAKPAWRLRDAAWAKRPDDFRRDASQGTFLADDPKAAGLSCWSNEELARSGARLLSPGSASGGSKSSDVLFASVSARDGAAPAGFEHLVGNVAEYVCRDPSMELNAAPKPQDVVSFLTAANALAVVGGSALSPPECGYSEAREVKFAARQNSYADVGFRLAFSSPETLALRRVILGARYLTLDSNKPAIQ